MTTADITITGLENSAAQEPTSEAVKSEAVQTTSATQQAAAGEPRPAEQTVESKPQGRENAFAITSFVLGIASIVSGWTFIAPIVGLIFGVLALRRNTAERTLALWGVWMNAIMLALSVIAVTVFALVMLVAFIAGGPAIFA